jgi:hypothetical protein
MCPSAYCFMVLESSFRQHKGIRLGLSDILESTSDPTRLNGLNPTVLVW